MKQFFLAAFIIAAPLIADAKPCSKKKETLHRNYDVVYKYSWTVGEGSPCSPAPATVKYTKTIVKADGTKVQTDSGTCSSAGLGL